MNGLNNRTYPICLRYMSVDRLHRELRNCRKPTDAYEAGINSEKIPHIKAEFANREFRMAA